MLGFKWETRKKHFFVNNHEKSDVREYRDLDYVPQYLEREIRCHRWVWLTPEQVEEMIKDKELPTDHEGITFTVNGSKYVEFHVDDHLSFHELGAKMHPFGGMVSHRKPADFPPILQSGQDEAIWKQFLSLWKAWSGPGGVKAIWPKDEGLTVMVSAIVSREFGFGVEWTKNCKMK